MPATASLWRWPTLTATLEGALPLYLLLGFSPRLPKRALLLPLLFHHLRSSVIGQALANLMRHRGHPVVSLNFLGDVGTAFGKLMVGIEELGEAKDADALNRTYVEA